MADPTLQTFCCHHTNKSDMALIIMQEFNRDVYNIVCMVSSVIGMLGAIYQILPREDSSLPYRWNNSLSRGRNIIVWLAVADFLASLGVCVRSALWMRYKSIMPMENDTSSVVFCAMSSAWIQYFYMATWIWTLCYAVDMKLLLGNKSGCPAYYHAVAWILPAILTTFGLIMLYIPDANCHNSTTLSTAVLRILPNYCATYVLIAVVMIVNPIMYIASTRDLETVVMHSMGQMTGRERKLLQTIRLKFALTNLVYYMCWTPNLINGILLWTLWFQLPIKAIIILWYIMAVTNPLQAFFNALVYQRWTRREKLRLDCCQDVGSTSRSRQSKRDTSMHFSESSPLLNPKTERVRNTPHISINGSSSL
ncbi:G-protein coupled receptor 143-like [Odontomachus brunneus]|uniref:G-protein coupled receptor 143-like n=1 Tax=Odontomachus brunneus TaxID=486640 RepID=UPI0013F21040|nr:G-protein coupled receptor 143-like [Odontomachus brunneus]